MSAVVTAALEADLLPEVTRTQLALGTRHSCALLRDGRVRCWGLGPLDHWETREVGAERALPRVVEGVDGVVTIDADEDLTCALRRDGSVWCWAPADLSHWDMRPHDVPFSNAVPARVEGVADARAVATGSGHACALRADGSVLCWGVTDYVYDPHATETCDVYAQRFPCTRRPVTVPGVTAAHVLAAGGGHTCAIVAGGAVLCWGGAVRPEDGAREPSRLPRPVRAVTNARQLAVGSHFACALLDDRTVRCWSLYDLLGGADPSALAAPPVEGATDVTALAAHEDTLCYARANGEGRCFGLRPPLRHAEPMVAWRPAPYASNRPSDGIHNASAYGAVEGAESLDAGRAHACLVRDDGEVRCWGSNESGALGDPRATRRFGPVPVLHVDGSLPSDEERERPVADAVPPPSRPVHADARFATWGTEFNFIETDPHTLAAQPAPLCPWAGVSLVWAAFVEQGPSLARCFGDAPARVTVRAVTRSPIVALESLRVEGAATPAQKACVSAAFARMRWPTTYAPVTIVLPLVVP